jgi:hypothetical protein
MEPASATAYMRICVASHHWASPTHTEENRKKILKRLPLGMENGIYDFENSKKVG